MLNEDIYQSPFSNRYASREMLELFSPKTRYGLWRRLWLSLAKAEKKLGLNITEEQIKDLEGHLDTIDFEKVKEREEIVRHDVMAHIYAYGEDAKKAKSIIHLGATSCYVTDNSDLIIYKRGLEMIRELVMKVMKELVYYAEAYKDTPTNAYTHYQPAQLTTVGKRFSLWLYNYECDLKTLDFVLGEIKFLGSRGTTGTEASFLDLFDGDSSKVDKLNELITNDFGFSEMQDVCGQTYNRKTDYSILSLLSSIAQSSYKFATDIRLLQHDGEIEEPFASSQVGSSAMAYKRNPVNCEKICSLSRYVINNTQNASFTSSEQWFERTLDDSANRRVTMPEAFLCMDAVLNTVINVLSGLNINLKKIKSNVYRELQFMATENILMEAVKRGGDRQALHEIIRETSMKVIEGLRSGKENDLLDRLAKLPEFAFLKDEKDSILDPQKYIGRCPLQVERYIKKVKEEIK